MKKVLLLIIFMVGFIPIANADYFATNSISINDNLNVGGTVENTTYNTKIIDVDGKIHFLFYNHKKKI